MTYVEILKFSTLERLDRLDWLRRRGEQHGLLGRLLLKSMLSEYLTIPSSLPR